MSINKYRCQISIYPAYIHIRTRSRKTDRNKSDNADTTATHKHKKTLHTRTHTPTCTRQISGRYSQSSQPEPYLLDLVWLEILQRGALKLLDHFGGRLHL